MGQCCTSTQPEHKPTNTQPLPSEQQPLTNTTNNNRKTDVGYEQQKTHQNIVATNDTDDDNDGHKPPSKHQKSMEDRIAIGHKHEHKEREKIDSNNDDDDNNDNDNNKNNINNKELIIRLINNAPTNTKSNDDDDLISVEHLRYVIRDLIETRNNNNNNNDNVSDFNIRKLLSKWKGYNNLCNLYLQLIKEYMIEIEEREINKNKELHYLNNDYRFGKKLGRGAYAIVKEAKRISDNKLFAGKIINKRGLNKYDLRGLRLEIAIMRDLNHDNVVTLYDVFESKTKICLIIGLLQGGELLDAVLEKNSFSEHEASQCFAQLCDGLKYIHSKNIAHRDLKPDNLLFSVKISGDLWNNLPKDSLKLVDFGLAERVKKTKGLTEYCGTPIYMAPEIFAHQEYTYSCDMWSAGCILYALLVGYPPFDFDENHDINELSLSVRNDDIDFDPQYWNGISNNAKDLILKLLDRNPKTRFTAQQALNHKWMRSASKELFDQRRMNRLRKFTFVRKLKRGVNAMIAVIRLIEIFEWFSEQKDKYNQQFGDTQDNVEIIKEKQININHELDKLSFITDQIENRINSLDQQQHEQQIEIVLNNSSSDEDDGDNTHITNFGQLSSLHHTSTTGKIVVHDDDDDDDDSD